MVKYVKRLEWTEAVHPSLLGAFFSPDWKKLAWVSQSVVQFMDVATGKTTVLLSHEDAVGAVAWAPDSTMFATSSTINPGRRYHSRSIGLGFKHRKTAAYLFYNLRLCKV